LHFGARVEAAVNVSLRTVLAGSGANGRRAETV